MPRRSRLDERDDPPRRLSLVVHVVGITAIEEGGAKVVVAPHDSVDFRVFVEPGVGRPPFTSDVAPLSASASSAAVPSDELMRASAVHSAPGGTAYRGASRHPSL
ncbi:MAG: hypothetical protein KAG89_02040 [Fulvimarina manganoxydans]|uniref:hypothetical protein n=1 Tax=Fulvimarina manganoxydans TaxID=937218 RepID=UPI002356A0D6|nr:hypothetical protein [Fulvimarina manganoxydans]MCK5930926.1 hypothetical protein [Fulvimarina manganoxydans]